MFPAHVPKINPDEYFRCEERNQITDTGEGPSPTQKTDAAIKESIYHAFWKDNFLRAMEYSEIDVHVKNGDVCLNGHIVSTTSQSRIENAIRDIPGVLRIKNNLVFDDKLTLEIAASLGKLEHTHGCKFFTGVSHGVVSLNGIVSDKNVKLLAEKSAANNPNVRGVINNLRVPGAGPGSQDQPFLQPNIGEIIYFLDGVSGVVKQVIINPNNRRVVAMTVQGRFVDQRQELKSLNNGGGRPAERILVLPMWLVRYLTAVSGFLNILSNEKNRYREFDPRHFIAPQEDWKPPYPYCPDDVLIPVEYQNDEIQIAHGPHWFPVAAILEDPALEEQLVNDSLGG
jgi:osmotically-inducible protein OsmY